MENESLQQILSILTEINDEFSIHKINFYEVVNNPLFNAFYYAPWIPITIPININTKCFVGDEEIIE